jgi:hypothetical protein
MLADRSGAQWRCELRSSDQDAINLRVLNGLNADFILPCWYQLSLNLR